MFPIVIPVGGAETLKYATGSREVSPGSTLVEITGLGFRPYSVFFINAGYSMGIGICNASGDVVRAFFVTPGWGATDPTTFTPNSDGFSFMVDAIGATTLTWYAIGK